MIVAFGYSTPILHKKQDWLQSHSATRGVTFQRTAPVVPVSFFELRSPDDWLITKSRRPTSISTAGALASTNPRFEDGIGSENRRKVSGRSVNQIIVIMYGLPAPSLASWISEPRDVESCSRTELASSCECFVITVAEARGFLGNRWHQ